jgi:hypothetical protein
MRVHEGGEEEQPRTGGLDELAEAEDDPFFPLGGDAKRAPRDRADDAARYHASDTGRRGKRSTGDEESRADAGDGEEERDRVRETRRRVGDGPHGYARVHNHRIVFCHGMRL